VNRRCAPTSALPRCAREAAQGGKVYLVGAGPGDPELLTLKAVRALGAADVVLVDDLVNRAVLEHVRADARIVEVGKRGGCKSTPQAFIERLMLSEARAGHTVVRLKGGDPFIFGRGGEEIATLTQAGIEVEVVSGITAGLAAPASLGIALTHRDACRGVAFVTGHTREGTPPDWRALANSKLTLVIYMGMTHIGDITRQLLAAGMASGTPVAVVENATLPSQRELIVTLGTAAARIDEEGFGSPSIVVVGEVAAQANAVRRTSGLDAEAALIARATQR
jgi:uroporphyrin-III C-methyltransferase